jgi:predicted nucleotidyltransferase
MRAVKPSKQKVVTLLLELAQREGVSVERVILFGSHGRGEAGPTSDYDLLVLVPDKTSVKRQWKAAGVLSYELGYQLVWPFDVVVSTLDMYQRRTDPMVETARRTGKTVYRSTVVQAPLLHVAG